MLSLFAVYAHHFRIQSYNYNSMKLQFCQLYFAKKSAFFGIFSKKSGEILLSENPAGLLYY